MAWDAQGNLYLAVGNNTGNVMQYAQTDERPGRANWDDQRTSANTNDLRGKILRIKPQPDGTYTIPPGNLFPPGTPNTRPEIYAMGLRNPWRVSIDSKTGWVYWGDVGPDASQDTANGPRGYDEHNQARGPGILRLAVFRRREPRVSGLRLHEGSAAREERSEEADQHVREQHRSARTAAGAAGIHLVPVRRVRAISARRHRLAIGRRRADLPPRRLHVGVAAVPRVLRRQVADRRSVARLDHRGRDGRARRLSRDGAVPARPTSRSSRSI